MEKLSLAITQDSKLLDSKDQDGFTVLHLASDRGNIEIVKYLIDAGANLNVQTDEDKETALHLACISEQFEIAKLLIDRGIDQTLVDIEGKTAFEQANESFVNKLVTQN